MANVRKYGMPRPGILNSKVDLCYLRRKARKGRVREWKGPRKGGDSHELEK